MDLRLDRSSLVTGFTEQCAEKRSCVSKFNRQFLLKRTLFFINLYCSKADFLKKANFLPKNMHFSEKRALGLCISFIDLLTSRNIEQISTMRIVFTLSREVFPQSLLPRCNTSYRYYGLTLLGCPHFTDCKWYYQDSLLTYIFYFFYCRQFRIHFSQ